MTGVKINLGSYLLSHTPAHAVPSAYWVLTTLFGMGRGVSPRQKPPKLNSIKNERRKSRALERNKSVYKNLMVKSHDLLVLLG
jgi:hypothetical protein